MKRFILVLTLACSGFAGQSAATPLGVNLVVNGDASGGTTPVGWTVLADSRGQGLCITTAAGQAGTAGLAPGVVVGVESFWGCGTGAPAASAKSMSQRLDISDLAGQIDSGQLEADWATLLQSRITDRVTANLSFLDASALVLESRSYIDTNGSANGGASYGAFDWSSITDTMALRAGTRFVDIEFSFTRPSGFSTDAFADNISFALRRTGDGSALPEPGSVALQAVALAALYGPRRQRAARGRAGAGRRRE